MRFREQKIKVNNNLKTIKMEALKTKIKIRIETNDECIGCFNLSKEHEESILSENKFLQEILTDLNCKECHQDSGHSIDCSNHK